MIRAVALALAAFLFALLPLDGAQAQGQCRFCEVNPPPKGVGGGRPGSGETDPPITDPQPGRGNNGAGNNGNGQGAGNGGSGNGNAGGNGSGDDTPVDPQPDNGNNGGGNNGNGNGAGNGGVGQGNGNGNAPELIVESDINFGRLLMIGAGAGTVLLDPQTGTKVVAGQLKDFGGWTVTGRASVVGRRNQQVQVNFPTRIVMRDPRGGMAELVEFETDLGPMPMLDANGVLEFNFTAKLVTDEAIGRGGDLRGTIPISVDYN